jgi:hypothetical protein
MTVRDGGGRIRRRVVAPALALIVLVTPDAAVRAAETELLLDDPYPLEARISFPAALLHWLDSLAGLSGAGLTAGKTRGAHQRQAHDLLGPPSDEERELLRGYAAARVDFVEQNLLRDPDGLTRAFFDSDTLERAAEAARGLLGAEQAAALERALEHFAPRYERIWNAGRVARTFLSRARRSAVRAELARWLADLARFFEVPAALPPRPVVLLVPVIDGHGTHAQAFGRHLLLEVRPRDGLLDEVAPIVHENAHFLMYRMDADKLRTFVEIARSMGATGAEAWNVLSEALPTALAQGSTAQRFLGRRWSLDDAWYHVEHIDRSAKRIYPALSQALAAGATFDEPLFRETLQAIAADLADPAPAASGR